jgi:hypothetical protein
MKPLNQCGACREDFTSVKLFDRHRVGVHAYTYSEGVRMDPIREDGRRCLDAQEMRQKGWEQNEQGRWFDPASVSRARVAFGRSAGTPS